MQAASTGQSGMTDRGFPIDTIRYDERMALLPRAGRAGRFRRYTDTGVARKAFVRRARELDLPLEHLRARIDAVVLGSSAAMPPLYRPNSRVIASIPSGVSGNIRRSINCRVIAIDCV